MKDLEIFWPKFTWTFKCNECDYCINSNREELAIDSEEYFERLIQRLAQSHAKKFGHYDFDVGVSPVEPLRTIDVEITVDTRPESLK